MRREGGKGGGKEGGEERARSEGGGSENEGEERGREGGARCHTFSSALPSIFMALMLTVLLSLS